MHGPKYSNGFGDLLMLFDKSLLLIFLQERYKKLQHDHGQFPHLGVDKRCAELSFLIRTLEDGHFDIEKFHPDDTLV